GQAASRFDDRRRGGDDAGPGRRRAGGHRSRRHHRRGGRAAGVRYVDAAEADLRCADRRDDHRRRHSRRQAAVVQGAGGAARTPARARTPVTQDVASLSLPPNLIEIVLALGLTATLAGVAALAVGRVAQHILSLVGRGAPSVEPLAPGTLKITRALTFVIVF